MRRRVAKRQASSLTRVRQGVGFGCHSAAHARPQAARSQGVRGRVEVEGMCDADVSWLLGA
jgi:hypothetical protein